MRGKPLCTANFGGPIHNAPHLALVNAPSPAAYEYGFSSFLSELSTALFYPLPQGVVRRMTKRHHALLISLTGYVQGAAMKINIAQV